jgi:protocatechuate 3,4-dioxygenase, beta subunit
MTWSKRELAVGLAGVALSACAPARRTEMSAAITPAQGYGPFYPWLGKPRERDADLTRLEGHAERAKGRVLDLACRVLGKDGRPVTGLAAELWQANAAGRYAHPLDGNDAPLDPNFQGYGVQSVDDEGRFRFLTVQPAPYPAGDFMRAAHIHFRLKGAGLDFVTVMYFPGDPWFDQDPVFNSEARGGAVFCTLDESAPDLEPGAALCSWDIVLNRA